MMTNFNQTKKIIWLAWAIVKFFNFKLHYNPPYQKFIKSGQDKGVVNLEGYFWYSFHIWGKLIYFTIKGHFKSVKSTGGVKLYFLFNLNPHYFSPTKWPKLNEK